MKKLLIFLYFVLPTSTYLVSAVYGQVNTKKLVQYVNPFIGTGGHGHTFPGPTMPFGACQTSPDTRLSGWDGCGGYHYSDSIIYGFSHTHLSGTGCSDYGDILLMPVSKEMQLDQYQYQSSFSHKQEIAKAGYYQVYLNDNKVNAELTSTLHGGVHRYTYEHGDKMYVVLDLKHRDEVLGSKMEKIDDYTIQGYRYSKAWASNQKIFYRITFSNKIESIQYEPVKRGSQTGPIHLEKSLHCIIKLEQDKQRNNQPASGTSSLLVKVAISGVDEAGAEKNMKAEMTHWNFDQYRKAAEEQWEKELSKITVKQFENVNMRNFEKQEAGSSLNQLIVFYTALYHCMIHPSLYSDVDGRYRGRDDKIHSTEGKFDYYTVFSLWDTYRGLHPLLSLLDKKRSNDFIQTFIRQFEQGGRLPVWELSSNETNCMIGYHVVSVIWDAYNKGIRNYDVEKAFIAMKRMATDYDDYELINGNLHMKDIARKRCADADALESYCRYGYVRADDSHESVSKTLEYAYDDWCIAQMANALDKKKDADYYMQRSQNWINVYDPTTGFMRARKNSTLYNPFSPYTVDNNYTEANSWQYSFYVPHDLDELTRIHGGAVQFQQDLDNLFSAKDKTEGREQADITGLIGQYAHGNEPSHQIAYLYAMTNHPEKTQRIIDSILGNFYSNTPDGLIGNEDCGQMSAWYVLSSIGLYSPCPGANIQLVMHPRFDLVKVSDENGRSFYVDNGSELAPSNRSSYSLEDFFAPNLEQIYNDTIHFDARLKHKKSNIPSHYSGMISLPSAPFVMPSSKQAFHDSVLVDIRSNSRLNVNGKEKIMYAFEPAKKFTEFTSPFVLKSDKTINFYTTNSKGKSAIQTASFTKLPLGVNVILKSVYNPSYSAGGPEAMIDGIHGKLNWRAGDWQGYQGQDVETILSFDKPKTIQSISTNFLEDQNSWIFYPKSVSFYTSVDSIHWTLIKTIPTNKSSHDEKTTISTFTATCQPAKATYVKMKAENFGLMPEWHEGRGNPTFIFVDEIEVK